MDLYFIRHGQSTNNALYAALGREPGRSHDPELTDIGRQQAERVAEFLASPGAPPAADPRDAQNRAGFGLTHLYTSLMVRAVSTGTVIANRLGLPLHAWVDWHEEGGIYLEDEATGAYRGLPGYGRAYFAQHYPALVLPETLGENGWWTRESLEPAEARTERARRVLTELLARHGDTGDRVGVVSHGGFFNHFLAALRGQEKPPRVGHLMNNCALARIIFPRPGSQHWPVVAYQNRVDFLPSELVTL